MEAPSVPRLLLIGSTVALVLSFPVRLLERWFPRGVAILAVVGSTVAIAIVGLILIIPFAINEITDFVAQIPEIGVTLEDTTRDALQNFHDRGWMDEDPDTVLANIQGNLLDRGSQMTETLLNQALDALTRSFNIAITTFGVIFVATYLLIDIPRFKEKFVLSFSPAYRGDASQLWSTIGESLSRYLSGLMVSIVIQGIMATIGLTALGVPYALVLGVWMSATAILPYVGAFLGAIPAVLIALTISWQMTFLVIGLYVLINQVESNFITPRIQGGAVRVHPLIIFISVIGGTEIAGPLGAIMAVPVLAVVRTLAEFLWVRLQIRQPQDTVLVALGGDDDGADSLEEVLEHENEDVDVMITANDDSQVNINAAPGSDIDVRVEDARVSSPDRSDADVATGYRRPPIARHRTRPPRRAHARAGRQPTPTLTQTR